MSDKKYLPALKTNSSLLKSAHLLPVFVLNCFSKAAIPADSLVNGL